MMNRAQNNVDLTFYRAVSSLSHVNMNMKLNANEVLFALNPS